jgi:aspartate-semialdehyde dehydrogenase
MRNGKMERIKVAIAGATGILGQVAIAKLEDHPWFELAEVAASENSAGKEYADAIDRWHLRSSMPECVRHMRVKPCRADVFESPVVISAVKEAYATQLEDDLANDGHYVFSKASGHRFDADVPLVVPEINSDHLRLLERQITRRRSAGKSGGYIVTDPNCSTTGLVLALAPLRQQGLRRISVATYQARSGAGAPGLSDISIDKNVKPYIGGEEDKMRREPVKIFGSLAKDYMDDACTTPVEPSAVRVSAHCARVDVENGHTEMVSLGVDRPVAAKDLAYFLRSFRGEPQHHKLPTAPEYPIFVFDEDDRPQPRLDSMLGSGRAAGMVVAVGRIRGYEFPEDGFNYKFVCLSNNIVRGGAGQAILNMEEALVRGYIR